MKLCIKPTVGNFFHFFLLQKTHLNNFITQSLFFIFKKIEKGVFSVDALFLIWSCHHQNLSPSPHLNSPIYEFHKF